MLGKDLAQLHAPLVKGRDVPDESLYKGKKKAIFPLKKTVRCCVCVSMCLCVFSSMCMHHKAWCTPPPLLLGVPCVCCFDDRMNEGIFPLKRDMGVHSASHQTVTQGIIVSIIRQERIGI